MDVFLSFSQKMILTISVVEGGTTFKWHACGVAHWPCNLEPLLDPLEARGSEGAPCLWLVPCLTVHLGAWAALIFSSAGLVYG